MKFKAFLSIAVALSTAFFIVSCDDDIDSIGQSIQPDIDNILLDASHVILSARTVAGEKNVFIETDKAVLGEIDDPVFGKLKADFLAEYFCATDTKFELGYDGKATIDSVTFQVVYAYSAMIGDTVNPMGVTIYELSNKAGLKPTFFTNIDPSVYCDKTRVLGQRFFSPQDLPQVTGGGHFFNIEIDKAYGENLYNKWMEDKTVLKNSEELRKVLKGIYVTTEFGNKSVINIGDANSEAVMMISYKYKSRKKNEPTVDSIMYRILPLPIAAEAIKLNHVWNSPLEDIVGYENNKVNTFVKAPAGVNTQISIPLKEIKALAKEKMNSDKYVINSAIFKMTGMTEAEEKLSISRRPSKLLFIHKDSLENFFLKGKKPDGISSMVLIRNSANNTYNFSSGNMTATSNNIAATINHYIKREKDEKITIDQLDYLLIPIDSKDVAISTSVAQITSVTNLFTPSAAIFRTSDKFMKMSLIFSKHNEIGEVKK